MAGTGQPMKAMVYDSKGTDYMRWVDKFPSRQPAYKEIKVQVKSVALNPIDYKIPTFPIIRSFRHKQPVAVDFCGEVTSVGEGVDSQFRVGDMVFGMSETGALCDTCTVHIDNVCLLPPNIKPEDGAAYPSAVLTAIQALRHARAEGIAGKGKEILVIGASGGVGHFVVQLAKKYGAKVTAVSSSRNALFVKELGAEDVLEYNKPGFDCASQAGIGEYDSVIDLVSHPGGPDYEAQAMKTLKPGSDSVYVATTTAHNWQWIPAILSKVGLPVQKANYHLMMIDHPTSRTDMRKMVELVSEGSLKAHVYKRYPFTDFGVREAFKQLETMRVVGRVLVEM